MNPSSLAVHFSSATDDHATPVEFFKKLDEEFHFDLDVCASKENAKCPDYYGHDRGTNGLEAPWHEHADVVWMNPPYGRQIGKWIAKAAEESAKGVTVVSLLPARTDTKYFHRYIYKQPNVEIRFVPGRLKFGTAKSSAPFPSMVVIFYPPPKATKPFDLGVYNEMLMKVFK